MDSVVGTEIGTVHNQRQGTGLATVLQGDRALDTYERMWAVDQAAQARRDQERAAKRNAAMTAIKSYQPEFFHKHNAEMTDALNKHFENGARLLARIDDPFTSTDPEAVAWQKERAKVQAMANTSMQVKDQYTALQKQLATANPEDYDARSLSNAVSYVDNPLGKIIDEGLTMPVLMKKKPALDTMDFIAKRMGTWQSTSGAIPTDNEVREFTRGLMSDPANQEQIVTSYGSRLAQMDADEKKALEQRARVAGAEPAEQLMFEDAKLFQKRREAFDLQKELKAAAGMAEGGVDYTEWNTPEGFGKAPKKGSKEAAIKASVDATFNSDPRWMEVYDREGELPRGQEETDAEYAKRVKVHMAKQIDPLVGISTKSGRTEKGAGDAELKQSQEQFIADIRSGDTVRMQGAANALVGEKFAANLTVENAVIQNQGGGNMWLELDVVTPMSTKDIKQQVVDANTGLSAEDVTVEERQGKKIITIGLAPGAISNQTLLGVLGNKKYDTKFTEKTPAVYDATATTPKVNTTQGGPAAKPLYDASYFK